MEANLSLFEPELYHGLGRKNAYFGLLSRSTPESDWRQKIHRVEDMPFILKALDKRKDTAISQAQYFAPARCVSTLANIGLVWSDLGDKGAFSGLTEAQAVNRIFRVSEDEGIPTPSIIVRSGRGYHAKWLFEKNVPDKALPRWNALETTITGKLKEELDADVRATDVTRVLRLPGTFNSRSETYASIAYKHTDQYGEIVRYGFDQLCFDVLPYGRPDKLSELDKAPKAKRVATGFYNIATLWWKRYHDLKELCRLRGWVPHLGGVPKGYRDIVLFYFAVALSWVISKEKYWNEIMGIASLYVPDLKISERRAFVGSTYRRLLATKQGDERRYKVSNERLIRDLEITRHDMDSLDTIVAPDIARARDRARTLERNRSTRAEASEKIKVKRAIRNEQIRRMHNEGASISLIAATLGISRPTVYAALQGDEIAP